MNIEGCDPNFVPVENGHPLSVAEQIEKERERYAAEKAKPAGALDSTKDVPAPKK